jgi:hypothetical protein
LLRERALHRTTLNIAVKGIWFCRPDETGGCLDLFTSGWKVHRHKKWLKSLAVFIIPSVAYLRTAQEASAISVRARLCER